MAYLTTEKYGVSAEAAIERVTRAQDTDFFNRHDQDPTICILERANLDATSVLKKYNWLRAAFQSTHPVIKGDLLAKPNYQFEKRQRDLAKKKKQEEKRQKKAAANKAADGGGEGKEADTTPPDAGSAAEALPDSEAKPES